MTREPANVLVGLVFVLSGTLVFAQSSIDKAFPSIAAARGVVVFTGECDVKEVVGRRVH